MNDCKFQINQITKRLASLLPFIDDRIIWTDYLSLSDEDLIAVGLRNGETKYACVTGLTSQEVPMHVIGCLDEVNFYKQFLTKRAVNSISEEISDYAKETAYRINEIKNKIKLIPEDKREGFRSFMLNTGIISERFTRDLSDEDFLKTANRLMSSDTVTSWDVANIAAVIEDFL